MSGRRILVTGSEGYLASRLVRRLVEDERVEEVLGVDIKDVPRQTHPQYRYFKASVTDLPFFDAMIQENFDTIVHTVWTFNPIHDREVQDELDIGGSRIILNLAKAKKVKQIVYLGSTTAYSPMPENPPSEPFLKEEDWRTDSWKRMAAKYRYSRNKAIVDRLFQDFAYRYPDINVFWMRGAIVLGPKTRNVVSYVADSPFTFGKYMFRVLGYDPPMQFISEDDMEEVLYRACMDNWSGVVNVSGSGTVKYSELIKTLGRKGLPLPAWLLYPITEILWKLRLLKFPASLIDLIRYPWVGDISLLREKYGFTPRHSSEDALRQLAARNK